MTSTPPPSPSPQDSQPSKMLEKLPPELRLKVYRESLVDFAPSSATPSPIILGICRKTRHEAMKLYFLRAKEVVAEAGERSKKAKMEKKAALASQYAWLASEAHRRKAEFWWYQSWQTGVVYRMECEGWPVWEWEGCAKDDDGW